MENGLWANCVSHVAVSSCLRGWSARSFVCARCRLKADVQITVLQLTRGKFQEMNLADKLEFKHRVAVAGGGGHSVVNRNARHPPSCIIAPSGGKATAV